MFAPRTHKPKPTSVPTIIPKPKEEPKLGMIAAWLRAFGL